MDRIERGDPRTLGRYRILARIGTGGMAVVYLAQSRGGRAVAVKVMHVEFARERRLRDRFRHEVAATRAAGGVYSPPVLDADPDAARPWMATEFLPSVTLREAVERFGPLPTGSVRRLAAGLAEALAAIHRAGIVHLDVKPANVLLTADGLRLIDFGIAAGVHPSESAGSWGFMSPEQVVGDAGPPSDIYSLGATLEYACGGQNADEALRTVIADCRRTDPAARPTAAELTGRLAVATRDGEGPGAPWLPPPVLAAIDVRASEADNPPMPAFLPPSLPRERRPLLLGGAAVVAVAVIAAAIRAVTAAAPEPIASGETPKAAPAVSSSPPSPSSAPSPSAKPVAVTFVVTGDGRLTSLAYAVDGDLTRLKNVSLPWRKTVEVPRRPGNLDWRLRFTFPAGKVRHRLIVDGSEIQDETHPVNRAFGYPYDVDTSGGSTISGPLPNAGG